MIVSYYKECDFNFAICYIEEKDISYILPIEVFLSYKGAISFNIKEKRQRGPKSEQYKEAWHLIEEFCMKIDK